MSRRRVIGLGLAGAAATLTGCAEDAKPAAGQGTKLIYWNGGLSPNVLEQAAQEFASRTKLTTALIDGDYRKQLVDILNAGTGLPAIVGIKGEDIASLVPRADLFADLHELGADEVAGEYVPWKWQQASAPDDRLIGFPIDIGPTATFYRADLFAKAGLASEPDAMAAAVRTWDDYIDYGARLTRALPGVKLVRNGAELFTIVICQGTKRYVDETNHYIGGEDHIKHAWDLSARLIDQKLGLGITGSEGDKWAATLADGTCATALGAAWLGYDIKNAAPKSSGHWRVAAGPATGANYGGSFLAIPQGSADHALSFEIIKWILAPENQATAFTDAAIFPAATAAFDMPALLEPDPFFGGQKTAGVFAASARKAHRVYEAPADATIHNAFVVQLDIVEAGRRNAADAWKDAVGRGRSIAESLGVN